MSDEQQTCEIEGCTNEATKRIGWKRVLMEPFWMSLCDYHRTTGIRSFLDAVDEYKAAYPPVQRRISAVVAWLRHPMEPWVHPSHRKS
jgi:hypothetical protein